MNNPFTLSFGQMPLQYISRIAQTNQIIDNFKADIHDNRCPRFRKNSYDDKHSQ